MDELNTQHPVKPDHRTRLLEGMARAVDAKGYSETTIADIVREASVSRRTFYEHFQGKPQCLIALYEALSTNALQVLKDAIDPGRSWQSQVEQALAAYLESMIKAPVLLRTLFVEIMHLGGEGMQSRRRVNRDIAQFILEVVNADAEERGAQLPAWAAMAIVGGIHELVLEYIEQGKVPRLRELAGPAGQLVRAVTQTEEEQALA